MRRTTVNALSQQRVRHFGQRKIQPLTVFWVPRLESVCEVNVALEVHTSLQLHPFDVPLWALPNNHTFWTENGDELGASFIKGYTSFINNLPRHTCQLC